MPSLQWRSFTDGMVLNPATGRMETPRESSISDLLDAMKFSFDPRRVLAADADLQRREAMRRTVRDLPKDEFDRLRLDVRRLQRRSTKG